MLRKSCLIGGQKTGAIITPVESIERAKDPSLDVLEKMKEADVESKLRLLGIAITVVIKVVR